MNPIDRYYEVLNSIPAPGEGGNCHTYLFRVAIFGIQAGLSDERIQFDLRASIPEGGRVVTDNEIRDAIRNARLKSYTGRPQENFSQSDTAMPKDSSFNVMARFVEKVPYQTEEELEGVIRSLSGGIPDDPKAMAMNLLYCLYKENEFIFIGEREQPGNITTIRTRETWWSLIQQGIPLPPFIIANPLTGQFGLCKDGKYSLRCDACVASFRYIVCEFDQYDRLTQLKFYYRMLMEGLPIALLVDSGNKSIHAWLLAACESRDEWEKEVEERVFPILKQFGADYSCKNESRLSRLSGHTRSNGKLQRMLYLKNDLFRRSS